MVILEGPDNSGKSTLGVDLTRLFGWPVEHSKKPELDEYEGHDREFMAYMHAVQHLSPKAVIRDRTYAISENIYGPIIRKQSMLGLFAEQSLKMLASTQIPIVYCRPPIPLILGTSKKEMAGVVENHRAIIKRYDEMMELLDDCGAFVYRYDYTNPSSWNLLTRNLMSHISQYNFIEGNIHEFIASSR